MWPRVVKFALEQMDERLDQVQQHYDVAGCGWVGREAPEPMGEAEDLETLVGPRIAANLDRAGAGHASPMQRHVLPAIKAGRDVAVQAPPGTGKTMVGIALPLEMAIRMSKTHVKHHKAASCAPLVVIVALTKERSWRCSSIAAP